MSRKLTPAAAMSTRSSPGPGSGVPCSATSSTSGPPCRLTTTVRIALSCRGCIAARTSAPTLGEKHLIGLAISQQDRRSLLRGDAPAAYTAAAECVTIGRKMGYQEGEMCALNLLGRASTAMDRQDRAEELLRESLRIAMAIRHRGGV